MRSAASKPPPPAAARPMTPVEWGMLAALALLWGGSFFFNGVAVRELPVFTVVVARVAVAALVLRVVMRLAGERLPADGRIWRAFLAMGLLNNVIPFSLIVWGQQTIASGVASILNAATPLFTVILAHGLTADEKLRPGKVAGVVAGLAGVAVVIGPDAWHGASKQAVAQLLCLAGAVSYALAGIFGRRFRGMGLTPLATATGQLAASSTVMVPLALLADRPWTLPLPSAAALAALLAMAVLSTALAYVLYFRILAGAGATHLLLVTFLIPVAAIGLGAAFLHETLLARHGAGMALIGLGLIGIDGRLWRRR